MEKDRDSDPERVSDEVKRQLAEAKSRLLEGMREPCRYCEWPDGRRVRTRNANGAVVVRHQCEQCGSVSSYFLRKDEVDPYGLPMIEDSVGENPACERCGDAASEWHHWAPQSVFVDSNLWPGSWLCRTCHREWHERTGLALGRPDLH